MSNPLASVIVVYRRSDYLGRCLESLEDQTIGNLEIFVIDHCDDLRVRRELGQRFPRAQWLAEGSRDAYGAALNAGIRKSTGEFVLCLNDDTSLDKHFIAEALEAFSREAGIGSVSGKVLRMDGVTLDSTGLFLSLFLTARERGYGRRDKGQFDRPGYVFGVTGAVAFYRRRMLDDIREDDYFDRDFGCFYEDLDVAWRAHRRGWKAYYTPRARAYHWRGGTVRQAGGAGQKWARRFLGLPLQEELVKNRYLAVIKNEPLFGFVLRLPFAICYDAMVWAYIVLFRPRLLGRMVRHFSLFCAAAARAYRQRGRQRKGPGADAPFL